MSWRALGTIDTIVLSFIVTGSISNALKIGATEVITKILLYYFHERIWDIIPFGRIHGKGPTHMRSLAKGVSWRTVGTIDTMVVAYFITGLPISAITIGGFEVFTKIGLFYLHERVWGKVWWGRISDARDPHPAAVPVTNADPTTDKTPVPIRDFEKVENP